MLASNLYLSPSLLAPLPQNLLPSVPLLHRCAPHPNAASTSAKNCSEQAPLCLPCGRAQCCYSSVLIL